MYGDGTGRIVNRNNNYNSGFRGGTIINRNSIVNRVGPQPQHGEGSLRQEGMREEGEGELSSEGHQFGQPEAVFWGIDLVYWLSRQFLWRRSITFPSEEATLPKSK